MQRRRAFAPIRVIRVLKSWALQSATSDASRRSDDNELLHGTLDMLILKAVLLLLIKAFESPTVVMASKVPRLRR